MIKMLRTKSRCHLVLKTITLTSRTQGVLSSEFFSGHKHPIIFICHIENGQDFVTLDEQGNLFVWTYHKHFLGSTGEFSPSHKYYIPLKYLVMERQQTKENKSKDNQDKNRSFEECYLTALDYRHQVKNDECHKIIVPSRREPTDDLLFFNEITYNAKKNYVHTNIGAYKKVEADPAQIGKVRHTKDRSIIAIELTKDHLFGS